MWSIIIRNVTKENDMDVSAAAQSIQAVNEIMQNAQQAAMRTAEKMVKVNVEMAVGAELGKGQGVDLTA
jgi:hypothetical protein